MTLNFGYGIWTWTLDLDLKVIRLAEFVSTPVLPPFCLLLRIEDSVFYAGVRPFSED